VDGALGLGEDAVAVEDQRFGLRAHLRLVERGQTVADRSLLRAEAHEDGAVRAVLDLGAELRALNDELDRRPAVFGSRRGPRSTPARWRSERGRCARAATP
jgi:hypothetical protein